MPRKSGGQCGCRGGFAARAALALCGALLTWGAAVAPAVAAEWQTLDWTLPGRIHLARLVTWQGRPGVMVTAPTAAPDGSPATLMQVLTLGSGAVQAAAAWTVPGTLQWAEPIHLADGEAWLGLRADGWYLGRLQGTDLAWHRVCACPSVFSDREDPDPLGTPYALDLDGDGVDELALPDPEGLTVYRWLPGSDGVEPWWRYRWEEPLLRDPKRTTAWQLPRYWLLNTHRTRTLDLLLHHADRIAAYPFPDAPPPRYKLSGAARVRLETAAIPPGMRRALSGMADATFPEAKDLLAAIPFPADPKIRANWLAALPTALWALQEAPLVVVPVAVPLPGAPKLHAGDYAFPVALEDLTGNGYVDLLQAIVRSDSSPLGLHGELRLYAGGERDGRWTIPDPATPITTNGAAVAEFFRPGTGTDAPAALVVASTDVTLGAILRSISSGRMRLDLSLHLLNAGKFDPKPNQHTRMVMEGIGSGARPLVLAADLDGDGWRELLISRKPELLLTFPGSPTGPRISAPPVKELTGPLPRKPQEAFVADLDGSGREAMVFWYRSGRYPEALRRTLRFVRWVE